MFMLVVHYFGENAVSYPKFPPLKLLAFVESNVVVAVQTLLDLFYHAVYLF